MTIHIPDALINIATGVGIILGAFVILVWLIFVSAELGDVHGPLGFIATWVGVPLVCMLSFYLGAYYGP